MQTSQFTKINEGFRCEKCGRDVPPCKSTCRNHCPYCLHSKHVDNNPGDRQNPCGGLLVPKRYELSAKKGIMLVFCCQKCGTVTRNKASVDDPFAADDYSTILQLGQEPP